MATLFGAVVAARNKLYDSGLLAARELDRPVISIGNISVGGSGKTPFTILLGEMLARRGISYDILSRGYGRRTRGALVVDPGGSPQRFGDEPLLMARRLRVPVIVGEDRYQAGRVAEAQFSTRLHLLDDGFQHRQLARDFDIVMVIPEDLQDRLLPAGRLREPLQSLRRADAIVLSSGALAEALAVKEHAIWRVNRSIAVENVPPRPVAFCGIARPQQFVVQLRFFGIEPAAEAVYRDHHAYTEKDARDLLWIQKQSEAGGFVTTEKDAINLGGYLSALQPLAVVPVRMELENAEAALDTALAVIAKRRGKAP